MGYIDDAFIKLKHNLEITATEQKLAAARHEAVRDFVRTIWQLTDDFLTGSYRRDTKTKKLKDVDVFLVIDPAGRRAATATGRPSMCSTPCSPCCASGGPTRTATAWPS